ncbi:MAG: M14 family zinc carboxypeptidase [Chloroflexi bacterium]|nr:M14 family zinc carboxypeptidase [Chloroflexota bacterium]
MSTKGIYWLGAILCLSLSLLGISQPLRPVQAKTLTASPNPTSQQAPPLNDSTTPTNEPIVARVYVADQTDINQLAATVDVWEVHHNADLAQQYVVAQLSAAQQIDLRARGYRLEIDAAKTALLTQPPPANAAQTSGIPGYSCYRTVEETYAAMQKLAVDHPNLASWMDIGDSWEKTIPGGKPGYDLNVLVLTNKAKAGPKPKFLLMAAIHAREYTTAELAARFAEELVAKYNVDPDVTWLLDYFEVHIIPQANPDGRKIAETGDLWRKNTDNDDGCLNAAGWGTDLNRNSSFKWGAYMPHPESCDITYLGPSAASEPETQAIEAYAQSIFEDQRGPDDADMAPPTTEGVFITLHSYAQQVLYPWGWTDAPAPNLTQLQTLGRKFGYFNGYQVCNGQDCLYGTSGTTDDFTYGVLGVASYTFEMGNNFFESCSSFTNNVLPKNMPALYYALKAARRPYQEPAGPDTLQVAVAPKTVLTGTNFILQATANDTRYNSNGWGLEATQPIAAAHYSIDAPAWVTGTQTYSMTALDGTFNAKIEAIQATVSTSGWPVGRHTVFIESRDQAGNWGTTSAAFVDVVNSSYGVALGTQHEFTQTTVISGLNYVLPVTNIGSFTDTYTVTVAGSTWPITAPVQIGPIAPSSSLPLTVAVSIPATATVGTTNSITVTLTSQADPNIQAIRQLATRLIRYLYYLPLVGR